MSTIDQPSGSKSPSTDEEEDGSFNEENFIESLTSQVDGDAIEDLIAVQKKALVEFIVLNTKGQYLFRLERFEKTNEMLATCRNLTEKRLDDAKQQFQAGKELINQSKADLESVFKRLRHLKTVLADRYPEIYVEQSEQVEQEFPQEEED
jgi:exonuclease VII small subunit